MVEVIMIICLAVILFIMIRKYPATVSVEEIVSEEPVSTNVESEIEEMSAAPAEEVKAKYSPEIEAMLDAARKFIEDDKLQPAEDKLIEIIQQEIKCATAYTLLGDICMKRHKSDEAEEAYKAAIRHDNEEGAAHFGLGLIYEEAGRLNEAVKEVTAAVRIDDKNDIWYHRLGELNMNLRMYSKAAMAYNRAANLKPDYGRYKEMALQAEKKQIAHKAHNR